MAVLACSGVATGAPSEYMNKACWWGLEYISGAYVGLFGAADKGSYR